MKRKKELCFIRIKWYTSKFENNSLSINSDTPNSLIVVSANETPTIL